MTTQSTSKPLAESFLCDLSTVEVLDWYDEPRLFIAQNSLSQYYLAYWADQDSNIDTWYYVPISESRIELVRGGEIDLRDAFRFPEAWFVNVVTTVRDTREPREFASVFSETLSEQTLPPVGDRLECVEPFSDSFVSSKTSTEAIHRIYVGSSTRRSFSFNLVPGILDKWMDCLHCYVRGAITPAAVAIGSFDVTLKCKDSEGISLALEYYSSLCKGSGLDASHLADPRFVKGLRSFHEFLLSIIDTKYFVRIESPLCMNESVIIRSEEAEAIVKKIDAVLTLRLLSSDVPQANSLERILRLVDLTYRDKAVTPKAMEVTPRHIYYYLHAAKVLGLVNRRNRLSTSGLLLVELDSEEKYTFLARQFEKSECGYKWLVWARQKSISGLNAKDAQKFLEEVCTGLSQETLIRRAQTLQMWVERLAPFRDSLIETS